MEEKKEKRVLKVELDDDVKKVSITGLGDDDKVVMMQELSEEDLDEATGGAGVAPGRKCPRYEDMICPTTGCIQDETLVCHHYWDALGNLHT